MIAGLLLIYKACYNLVPRVFPIRPLEMSVTHGVGLVDPTKVGKMSSLIVKCKTTHRTPCFLATISTPTDSLIVAQ